MDKHTLAAQRFSQACENNKAPILQQLKSRLANSKAVLEIGSGTGQHAAYFAKGLPHVIWQPTDVEDNHPSIEAWVKAAGCPNVAPPMPFFIGLHPWSFENIDAVFSANTAHIMQANEVQLMMELIGQQLPDGGIFCQYGPFCVAGEFTSASNADFDQSLRQRGLGGIRDIDELISWAPQLQLCETISMPANNLLLVWSKATAE
ncbi:DUF938 domain-containing protein [Aliiglaciecola sp. LCG003]|uniref:DUF938 domain-containing protein n=1 Tax=Aliiglaciecola sp. LCG003 TaxID=3053655 RepID=UPI0025742901|nr:DUF938 domain-containing protein [Aliiglaciecola sp. LCG003]WJG08382.1 DUF938 domain-containing protein [Aliiglaciecola sp. LCG003]